MQVNKVQILSNGSISVGYQEYLGQDEETQKSRWDKISGRTIQAKAVERFYDILAELKPHAVELLEIIPAKMVNRVRVRGFTFTYTKEHKMGGEMIVDISLSKSEPPLHLVTPHKVVESYNDDKKDEDLKRFNEECGKLIAELHDETVNYINGKRLNIEMDLKE